LWQWQVSEVLETEIATCGQRNLEIKKSKIWRKEAKTKHWESIIRQARETLSSPERIDQSYLESMDQSFLDLFSKTKLPGPLNWGREQGDWLVSYTNSKMRVSGVITDNDGRKLEVVLGQTWDWDEGGKFRIRYELEAEPDDPRQWDNPSDILKLICQTYDITHWPKELSEAEPSPSSDYTLKRIQSSN
jgi:hypothetical protein